MPRKTTLYIDIDDTIIALVLPGSGDDPGTIRFPELSASARIDLSGKCVRKRIRLEGLFIR
jgi:hypothetical protein